MAMVPVQSIDDPDVPATPRMREGRRGPIKMKTPGMGALMGAPRHRGLASMGKITPGALPFDEPQKMAKGGKVGSASKRADGCCVKGKTKGKMV
jgi:hypothetical protein